MITVWKICVTVSCWATVHALLSGATALLAQEVNKVCCTENLSSTIEQHWHKVKIFRNTFFDLFQRRTLRRHTLSINSILLYSPDRWSTGPKCSREKTENKRKLFRNTVFGTFRHIFPLLPQTFTRMSKARRKHWKCSPSPNTWFLEKNLPMALGLQCSVFFYHLRWFNKR